MAAKSKRPYKAVPNSEQAEFIVSFIFYHLPYTIHKYSVSSCHKEKRRSAKLISCILTVFHYSRGQHFVVVCNASMKWIRTDLVTSRLVRLNLACQSTVDEVVWKMSRNLREDRLPLHLNPRFYDKKGMVDFEKTANDSPPPAEHPLKEGKISTTSDTYYIVLDRPTRVALQLNRLWIFGNIYEVGSHGENNGEQQYLIRGEVLKAYKLCLR